jgi:hypothetical protein
MNDIYEHKAKKYKYKYLKLKNELEGGEWYDFFKYEKTIIKEIIKELNKLNQRIITTVIPNYKNCKIFGSLEVINSQHFYPINDFIQLNARIQTVQKNDTNTTKKFPEILIYYFNISNISGTWTKEQKKFKNVKFQFIDLKNLEKKFPNEKYPYYKDLIDILNQDDRLKDVRHIKSDQVEEWNKRPIQYSFEEFYEKYILPIAKNIDIYLIVMTIKELFDRYRKQLNKYKEIYTLVDNLVNHAYYNKMLLIDAPKLTPEQREIKKVKLINEQNELQTIFDKNIAEGKNTNKYDHLRSNQIKQILKDIENENNNEKIPTVTNQIETIIEKLKQL